MLGHSDGSLSAVPAANAYPMRRSRAEDRKRFHQVSPRTPGSDLPHVKWRTV